MKKCGVKCKMKNLKYEFRQALSKGHYNLVSDEVEALKKLNSILSKYPEQTRKKVIKQMDLVQTTPSKMLLFVEATERYNKNITKQYNKAIKNVIKPAWEDTVKQQSEMWKSRVFTDKGNLSKEGENIYKNFVSDRLSQIIPTQEKSIILSNTQIDKINFEKTLITRLNMGLSTYTSKISQQYFDNYVTAIRKKRSNPQPFIDLYNSMTVEQKIAFSYSAMGYIKYQYTQTDESKIYQEMEEEINNIKNTV